MFELRPYQRKIIDDLRVAFTTNHHRQIVGLPTGGGKTIVAAAIADLAALRGNKPWFVVERTTLIQQTIDKFETAGLKVGVVWADHGYRSHDENVVVASVQTLASRFRIGYSVPNDMGLLIIDEVHMFHRFHRELMNRFPTMPVIGLSATPMREDLAEYFSSVVRGPSTAEMIAARYLVPFKCFGPASPDLSGIATRGGDFAVNELSARMRDKVLVGDVVSTWRRLAESRLTIVFAVDIAHSESLVAEFRSEGIAAAHLDYRTSHDDRVELFEEFREGTIRVLVSVAVLSLGFDVPEVQCVVLARPTLSEMLHIQQCGRGARPSTGKMDCLVIDHAANCMRHGLPQDFEIPETLSSGRENERQRKRQVMPADATACHACAYLYSAKTDTCPNCGAIRKRRSSVTMTDGTLERIDASALPVAEWTEQQRQDFYWQLRAHCELRGYKPGWANYKYRDRFGVMPQGHWTVDAFPPIKAETQRWILSATIRDAKRRRSPA